MNKIIAITLISLTITALSATEMKCESGKCTSGKNIPKKSSNEKKPLKTKTHIEKQNIFPKLKIDKSKKNKLTVKQLFNVRTTKIIKEKISHKQTNYGFIVADESLIVDVVAWYSGFIEVLYADELYSYVKKGDVLAKVYSPEVYKAKQDYLNSIKYNFQRPSPAMVKSSRIKLELLNVCQKEIEDIEKNKKVNKLTTIFAPSSGWIFKKNIHEGSSFNSKKILFQIVDLSTVWMEAKLYQKDLPKLNTFKNFTIRLKGYQQTFQAKKELLYPLLNPKEATATLRLSIENHDAVLKPGMYATLNSETIAKTRLLIPRTAIIRKEGMWYAFLATDFKGEYEPVQIKVKPVNAHYYEVLSGLNEGESVVENALFMMDSDAQINSIY